MEMTYNVLTNIIDRRESFLCLGSLRLWGIFPLPQPLDAQSDALGRDRQHSDRVARHQQRRPDLVRDAERGNRVDLARDPRGSPRRVFPWRHLAYVALYEVQLAGDSLPAP